jgi:hypothetical protein
VKHATKLGYALRVLEKYRRVTQENSIIKDTTGQVLLSMFLLNWYPNMLIELDNLQPKQEDKVEEDNMNWFFDNYCGVSPPSLGQALSLDDLHKAKIALAKANVPMSYVECSSNPIPVQEKTMTDIDDDFDFDRNMTEAERTRKFFLNDLEVTVCNKRGEARKHFGLEDEDAPSTFEDFISRIKEDKWTVNSRFKDRTAAKHEFNVYNVNSWIRWGNIKEDHAGYVKAMDALDKASTSVERLIRVVPLENLPHIVEEFENTTFH